MYPLGTRARRDTYVQRNRIIAGLSDSIFVTECNVHSGTMHTVRYAHKYNKDIYVYDAYDKTLGNYDGNEHIIKNFNGIGIKIPNIDDMMIY